jgi:hypothetical protein
MQIIISNPFLNNMNKFQFLNLSVISFFKVLVATPTSYDTDKERAGTPV